MLFRSLLGPNIIRRTITDVSITVDLGLGVAVNGLDAGTEAASTWYYVWLIWNGTLLRGLLSTSATAPTMPSGYTWKALIGVLRNDGSSNLVRSYQTDREVFVAMQTIFTATAGSLTYVNLSGTPLTTFQGIVPPIAKIARGTMGVSTNANHAMAIAGDANGVGSQCVAAAASGTACDGFNIGSAFVVPLLSSQNFYWKADSTGAHYQITISGYRI